MKQPKPTRIIQAWGAPFYTPAQLSLAMKELCVSHTVVGFASVLKWFKHHTVDGLNPRQPAWPVICHCVGDIARIRLQKSRQIVFVCDSMTALSHTNITLLPDGPDIMSVLKAALQESILDMTTDWKLRSSEPEIQEYVSVAAKPSFLSMALTVILRINPYADRKRIQSSLILYLAGRLSEKKIRQELRSNLRAEEIIPMLESPEARKLVSALQLVRTGLTTEAAAEKLGIDVFDLNYVTTSLSKL